jgi:lipid A 3-O-deacylase
MFTRTLSVLTAIVTLGATATFAEDTFHAGANRLTVSVGGGPGTRVLGSTTHHDLALARVEYGGICSRQLLTNTFLAGNVELAGEGFGGAQFSSPAYVAGVGGVLRYNLTRSQSFVPFIEVGAGVLLTDLGGPDLSGIFQFHEEGGLGAHLFLNRRDAITFDYRFMHISNAGISKPNLGVNNHSFFLGFTRFF